MTEKTPTPLTDQLEKMHKLLEDAIVRMNRARTIFTNGFPTPENNRALLDTKDIEQ